MTFSPIRTPAMGTLSLVAVIVWAIAGYVASAVGQDALPTAPPFSDYRVEKPGVMHRITVADLPKPFATQAANNGPKVVPRPEGADAAGPCLGYTVTLLRRRPRESAPDRAPRRTATSSSPKPAPGRIRVLRGRDAAGKAQEMEVFAADLNRPFGIAFYPAGPNPQFVYVGNTDSIVRFPVPGGRPESARPQRSDGHCRPVPGGGHSTRDLVFSPDGKKMFVGVGSRSNVDDPDTTPAEKDRATVLEFNVDGTGRRVYASGIRNAAGLAIHPTTGQVWVAPTSATTLATTWSPTTSRTSRRAASTAGRGTTWAATRIRATKASTRS